MDLLIDSRIWENHFRALENRPQYGIVKYTQGDSVAKRKITAKEILADLRSGLDDPALMNKYNLSSEGLQSLFKKMLKAGVVTREDLDSRAPLLEKTVELGLFICPACGNIEHSEFQTCPKCGFAAPEYMKTPDYGDQDKPKKPMKTRGAKGTRTGLSRASTTARGAKPDSDYVSPKPDKTHELEAQAKQLKIMGLASIGAYILFFILTIIVLFYFSSQGVVSTTTAILGIFALQIPIVVTIVTVFLLLNFLTRSLEAASGRSMNPSSQKR